MREQKDVTLKIGDSATLKTSFMSKTLIFYTGMPNRETFSLAVSFTSGHASHAYNLFYPKSRRAVEIGKSLLEILLVTPDEMRLNILAKPNYPTM
jgi:hypothetical protein